MTLTRRTVLTGLAAFVATRALAAPSERHLALVAAARGQVGVTTLYDPSYVGLHYPMGDVPRGRGVCTDVLIRALRDAAGKDLQRLVHEDMKAHFASYPKIWGLKSTDRNIDHRRVPNLERYFERRGFDLLLSSDPSAFEAGDIVSWRLPGNLPHIGIASDRTAPSGAPLIIHNIGAGTREEDILFAYDMTRHFRLPEAFLG